MRQIAESQEIRKHLAKISYHTYILVLKKWIGFVRNKYKDGLIYWSSKINQIGVGASLKRIQ